MLTAHRREFPSACAASCPRPRYKSTQALQTRYKSAARFCGAPPGCPRPETAVSSVRSAVPGRRPGVRRPGQSGEGERVRKDGRRDRFGAPHSTNIARTCATWHKIAQCSKETAQNDANVQEGVRRSLLHPSMVQRKTCITHNEQLPPQKIHHHGAMAARWWHHGGTIVTPWWHHGYTMIAPWWPHGC